MDPKIDPTVWLLTDFGLQDAYVGTMKAVIKSICPKSQIYDLTHGIAPQQISQGAFILEGCLAIYPLGPLCCGRRPGCWLIAKSDCSTNRPLRICGPR